MRCANRPAASALVRLVPVGLSLAAMCVAGCGRGDSGQEVAATKQAASDQGRATTPDKTAPQVAGKANPAADAALQKACVHGGLEEVNQALADGADVNSRDERGRTPLMLAAFDGRESIVRQLLEQAADVNAVDVAGRSALMYAASGPFPATVRLLLVNGADVDLRDRDEQFTALMFAAAEGHAKNVELLLSHKADRTLQDADGETAADFARKNDHADVVKLLE